MIKGGDMLTLELDDLNDNYIKLVEISGHTSDDVEDYALELDLQVEYNYYYDRGNRYGIPENCYSSEFELEIIGVYLEDNTDISKLLSDNDIEKIENILQDRITL